MRGYSVYLWTQRIRTLAMGLIKEYWVPSKIISCTLIG